MSDNRSYLTSTPIAPPAIVDSITAERLQDAMRNAYAPHTVRAYTTAWRAWSEWAAAHAAQALPADPEAVGLYLAGREREGAGMATLRMAAAAITAAHRAAGHDTPCTAPTVVLALRGFARDAAEAGHTPRQANPLTAEAVMAIRASLRGKVNRSHRAARDMALVSVMSDAGLRRSEAAELRWSDIAGEPDGSGRVTIRRSKTDQEGEGAAVAITPAAMQDLQQLARLVGSAPERRVFAVSDRTIARRIAALAAAAELAPGYSGHSGRVGMAMRMTRNGAPAAAVMRQGRWKTVEMVARYTRNEAAGEALKYL